MAKIDLGEDKILKEFLRAIRSQVENGVNTLIQEYIEKNRDSPELEDLSTFKIKKEEIVTKQKVELKEKTQNEKIEEIKKKDEKSIKKELDNAPIEDLIYVLDKEVEEEEK